MRENPVYRSLRVVIRRLERLQGLISGEAHADDLRQKFRIRDERGCGFGAGHHERVRKVRIRDVFHHPVRRGFHAGIVREKYRFLAGFWRESCEKTNIPNITPFKMTAL